MVENFFQRDAWFQKMKQLAIRFHLRPAQETTDPQGHKDGVDVSKVQDPPMIDISKYLPDKWNGTKATQIELMQLILDINQEAQVFRSPDWQQRLAYYQQQLKTLMNGGN